ncbi:MAG TPA: carbon monoxide dehydrogenase subunit G [Ramlibacter sp.]|nr:carbon monoxide dehydrogenase subunit G [Ramlibacter sp.]
MKMSDEIHLPVAQDVAWKALNDIDLLRTCIPGCETINLQDDGSYEVVVAAAVGPIRARFKGEMRMLDVVAPTSYRLEFNMQGGAVGHGRGEAAVELSSNGDGTTLLKYTAAAHVGGKLAQIGARLIDITAKKMAGQFFEAFRKQLVAAHEPEAASEPKDATAGQAQPGAKIPFKGADAATMNGATAPFAAPGAASSSSPSETILTIKIEVTLIDQTSRRSRSGGWWNALLGR